MASWRPDLSVQVGFNANPNDPTVVPIWSDLSTLFLGASNCKRGRQYELDINQANQPTLNWLDPNEYLNPANTSSPYSPNVLPLRQIIWQAMWPNQTTGNLMNANQLASSILGTTSAGYDPSFESYTNGASVPWITAVGGVTPTVGTTTPHTGSKDLTYSVITAATEQGVTWQVPAIPGRQYTASAYVRQSSASAQTITVGNMNSVVDAFNRAVSGGWGTPDGVGAAWTTAGGAAGDYSVTPGLAVHALNSVNVSRAAFTGTSAVDSDTVTFVEVDQVATGAAIRAGMTGRRIDASNFYLATLEFGTDQSLTLRIIKRVAGVETTLASSTLAFTYSTATLYGLRFRVAGTNLSASGWQQTGSEPTVFTLTTTDSALTGAGQVGAYSTLLTSNTNTLPVHVTFTQFGSYATVSGSSTSTTGAYVRLTVTFTATQPVHTIGVLTLTGATAGTVLVDDVQYEQGATATTFTTTGPTIYGVFRGYVERWPSTWANVGFLGLCSAACVDAFEPLNLNTVNPAYYQQVLALGPALYWPLNDSAKTTVYGEQSGNNGPAMNNIAAKFGAGTLPSAGASTNIVGDPGGTGVTFTPSGSPTSLTQAVTIIGAGQYAGQTPLALPPTPSIGWAMSGAVWITCSPTSPATNQIPLAVYTLTSSLGSTAVVPLMLSVAGPIGGAASVDLIFQNGDSTQHFLNTTGPTVTDGLPHLLVGTVSQTSGGSTTLNLYLDGSLVAGPTTLALGSTLPSSAKTVEVGGNVDPLEAIAVVNGTVAHAALWTRALSSAEVTKLWDAGGLGNAGETSGQRITDILGQTWTGYTSINTGLSVMGASTVTAGQSVLTACQDVTTTEQGNFWVDKDGVVSFADRNSRYLDITSMWTFGENSPSEYPYQGDVEYDYDPTFVYNQVTVTNADGVTATVTNTPSQRAYFTRSNTLQVDLESDDDAIQLAYWQVNTHDQPVQRLASLTFQPPGNANLWPVVLGMEVGMRVTVTRRPKAANSGAGITMTGDFFIESISHDQVDMEAGTWTTTLLLSPAVLTSNVWLLDNATYSVLGSTTRLAY